MSRSSYDVVCVGGGAVGLAVALDLSQEGLRVAIVDRADLGKEASWAGAGIIPPASESAARTPYDRLRAISYRRFGEWAELLRSEMGGDVGYRRCGAIELPEPNAGPASMEQVRRHRTEQGIDHQILTPAESLAMEPQLRADQAEWADQADWIPGVCQIRNPRYLASLQTYLVSRGGVLVPNDPVVSLIRGQAKSTRVEGVRLASGRSLSAAHVVVTAGAWSGQILQEATGQPWTIYPVQGQILVLEMPSGVLGHILLQGKRYLVPRDDGLVLVGSTEEEVGFTKQVTAEAVRELREFAAQLVPALARARAVHAWAGLRPASRCGHPVIGPVPGMEGLWVATGHFRHGVQQSLGTSRLLADWIVGRPSFALPADFALEAPADLFESPFQS